VEAQPRQAGIRVSSRAELTAIPSRPYVQIDFSFVRTPADVKSEEKASHVQHVRFAYRYDAYGNWTERIVWQRMAPNADERPSNIERRTITYYGR
jgi:hypothetical protein